MEILMNLNPYAFMNDCWMNKEWITFFNEQFWMIQTTIIEPVMNEINNSSLILPLFLLPQLSSTVHFQLGCLFCTGNPHHRIKLWRNFLLYHLISRCHKDLMFTSASPFLVLSFSGGWGVGVKSFPTTSILVVKKEKKKIMVREP